MRSEGSLATASASAATTASAAATASATTTVATTTASGSAGNWLLAVLFELLSELSEWGLDDFGLAPEIWGKVLVGLGESLEGSLDKVLGGSGMARGAGVAIIDTCELEELLGHWSTDNTGSTRCGHELDSDGGALSRDLAWHGMDRSDLVTPIASSHWNKLELGGDEGTLDGDLDFLSDLDSESNVAVLVTDDNDGLEAGSLTSHGLLLNGDDLHDLIRELNFVGSKEILDDSGLLDWDRVGIDLLKRVDVSVLDKSSELGLWYPVFLVATATTWAATTSTAASTSAASESATSAWGFSTCWCCFSHLD